MLIKPISFLHKEAAAGGTSTFNVEQRLHTNWDITPADLTFGTNITVGNILICAISNRSGNSHTNHGVTDTNLKTWNKFAGYDNELSDGSARCACSIWWREVESSGETDLTPQVSATGFAGDGLGMMLLEVSADGSYTWTESASSMNGSGTSDINGTGSGTTSSTSKGDHFVLAFGVTRSGTDEPTTMTFSPQTDDAGKATSTENQLIHAEAIEASGQSAGTFSTTITTNGSGNEGIVGVAVWQNGA